MYSPSPQLCVNVQAGDILSSAPATASSVPPAPAAPSEDTASIESFSEGVEEVVPDVAGAAYPPPPPPPPKVFGSFLPVTETTGDVKVGCSWVPMNAVSMHEPS